MQAAPAVRVTVPRSLHWVAALAVLAAAAMASTVAWALVRGDKMGAFAVVLVAGLALHTLRRALHRSEVELRWDGAAWWLHAAPRSTVPVQGRVVVALDLGAWLLLRFDPLVAPPLRRRSMWLPLQRSRLRSDWHALRCALYSPRPAAAPSAPGQA